MTTRSMIRLLEIDTRLESWNFEPSISNNRYLATPVFQDLERVPDPGVQRFEGGHRIAHDPIRNVSHPEVHLRKRESFVAAYLRAAQAYILISMPTGTSTILGVFQAIWALLLNRTNSVLSNNLVPFEKFAS
jgi:hypothetical protein